MGTTCASLVEDWFYYEGGFMSSLSVNNQADVIKAYNFTSKYLDDLLNINNPYFELKIGQVYSTEHQDHAPLILKVR